ncbi:MAG: bifunctional diaminohydroxyphosphoribosylaminopyrimidine deaminase/5-amino-6-(5-phosphoribosylamino)uracil reductase RibD [Sphingobium sp.]|nr:bifunctional diaminohydroxyphosphoribosylaminopyrimidine deaminase/5-amino-6-(5-phosphoribosylamino)uracil reductase RibD [Sphingobium sp.]MCI1754587.1 bifunctional diaminohydroxyphosphoribosylaminopyrimidine deaminase/5-amino-6-(5-phosphoribosylamino)uracil reductase RibD [Sphingobium sp.]MCI2052027.1 bifunctional diaminohydroxyphosphoribosylaminopyrimidine deaminase/5-amino-6-(5-phosphoribosylamino)uracil reductase RibD [Sphingobium sp.]
MRAAIALSLRGLGRTAPNPNVGCIIVRDGTIVGRGWTQPGGRPHAEAQALAQADGVTEGATAYVTLEPCFHLSPRGPRCVELLHRAKVARVVIAAPDPDPRTNGQSLAWLREQGIDVSVGLLRAEAEAAMTAFFARQMLGRPAVTLKLGLSLDGCIACADGTSQWITGATARAHAHLLRASHDAILVGRGTWWADKPRLDVRLSGLEDRAPRRILLGHGTAPEGWTLIDDPARIADLEGVSSILIEGGAQTAAAFLRADLVDRLVLYRAPILIGGGKPAIGDIGLPSLDVAHGRWQRADRRPLGEDMMEVYARTRAS